MIKLVASLLIMFLPIKFKLYCYRKLFGYQLDVTSKIGFSLILPTRLYMYKNAKIGHLNVIKGLTEVSMLESASIGSLNWISAFPEGANSVHFADQLNRSAKLIIGKHSSITNRHLIDCTDSVSVGSFSTIAGYRSQILTHSISIIESRQRSGPVSIGDYTFVGTGSIILPNSKLPNFSVLGAGSVLNKYYSDEYRLYAGSPARPLKEIDKSAAYFSRNIGYIY